MLGRIIRSVGAVLVGFIPALLCGLGVEVLSLQLYPFPPGVDPSDLEVCRAHVAQLPAGAFLLGAAGWGLGTLLSSWLATRLGSGRHRAHGIVVGLVLIAAAVTNMLMLPYPVWFWMVNLVVLPLCTYLGSRLGGPRS
jgi:hypothetical protein